LGAPVIRGQSVYWFQMRTGQHLPIYQHGDGQFQFRADFAVAGAKSVWVRTLRLVR
jgi:hypothetical protein